MKLSQILKIAGPIVGGLALVVLVIKLFGAVLTHPILDVLIVVGVLAYFAGKWYAKKGK